MEYYSKKAKIEGYRARSIYKLRYLNKKYKLVKEGDSVLDLGCFPGSWLEACKEFKASLIVGVDIKNIRMLDGITFIQGDINSRETIDKIKSLGVRFDCVISDVAPKTTGILDKERSFDLSYGAYRLARRFLKYNGNYLCKVFQSNDVNNLFRKIKQEFAMAKITKPVASKKRSYEVYIVAKSYKMQK